MALIEKLNAIGDAIRSKTGDTKKFTLSDMPNEIKNIKPVLQTKNVTPSKWMTVVEPQDGYDGLERVIVDAIPEQYIVPSGTLVVTNNGEYDVTENEKAVVNVTQDHSVEDSIVRRTIKTYSNERITAVAGQAFWGCTSLREVRLPNVETILTNAFRACTSLTMVELGANARTISTNVFYGCTKLAALIIRSNSVCTLGSTNAFTSTPIEDGTGFAYVPSALVDQYKSASNWKTFSFRAIEDYPDICG